MKLHVTGWEERTVPHFRRAGSRVGGTDDSRPVLSTAGMGLNLHCGRSYE
jgi:hypothetical protein